MSEENKMKIEFMPGCFDNFEGTQEELDELIAEIHRMFESGEAQEMAKPLDYDNLDEEEIAILEKMAMNEESAKGRKLQ